MNSPVPDHTTTPTAAGSEEPGSLLGAKLRAARDALGLSTRKSLLFLALGLGLGVVAGAIVARTILLGLPNHDFGTLGPDSNGSPLLTLAAPLVTMVLVSAAGWATIRFTTGRNVQWLVLGAVTVILCALLASTMVLSFTIPMGAFLSKAFA